MQLHFKFLGAGKTTWEKPGTLGLDLGLDLDRNISG